MAAPLDRPMPHWSYDRLAPRRGGRSTSPPPVSFPALVLPDWSCWVSTTRALDLIEGRPAEAPSLVSSPVQIPEFAISPAVAARLHSVGERPQRPFPAHPVGPLAGPDQFRSWVGEHGMLGARIMLVDEETGETLTEWPDET